MAKKRVFVSSDWEKDIKYQHLLSAWNANPDFEFTCEDHSNWPPVNSEDESRIKAGISRRMSGASYLLVIVGKETSKSKYVTWEIEKAKELKLKLVGVKIDKEYTSPAALFNSGASWAMSFTQDAIIKALNSA